MPGLPFDDDRAPLYTVGQVASMLGVPSAFLRRLDAHDVVSPGRSDGGQRRYSRTDVYQVQDALGLIDDGLTLAGVRRVLDLQAEVADLRRQIVQLEGRAAGRAGTDHRPAR